jgi:hypothetical protein
MIRDCAPYACGDSACATSCVTSASCAPGYTCQSNVCARAPGLVLFWRFEDTGTTAIDSSGNNHVGVFDGTQGTTPVTSTLVPTSMYPNLRSRAFNLANRHAVKIDPIPADLKFTNNFTMALWYRSTQIDPDSDIGSELLSAANTYLIRLRPLTGPTTHIEFFKGTPNGGGSLCRGPAPTYLNGNWHHVAAVVSSTAGVKVYFDGAEICSTNNTSDLSYAGRGTGLWLGRHGQGETQWDFGGNMDEVRLYNRTLTPAEIAALAQGMNN